MSDSTINVRFSASDQGLEEAIRKAEQALLGLNTAVKGTSSGLSPLNSATKQIIDQWDRGAATLDKAANAFGHITAAIEANEISATQAARVLSQIEGAASDATKGMGGFQAATAGSTREFIVLAHEAVAGNFSRIPGSLMVLTSRMGALTGATLGWAAAIGVVGFATYELVSRWTEVESAVKKAAGEMVIAGTYQGGSSDDAVRAGVDRLKNSFGANTAEATKSEDALRTLGGSAAQYTDQIRDAAAAEATLNHGDLEKTTTAMVAAFNGGAAGALHWAESNHVLTAEQQAQIEVLVKAGSETAALGKILEAMKSRFVDSGTAVAGATKQLKDYFTTAALFDGAAGGVALSQSGLTQPSPGDLKPKSGSQADDPAQAEELAAVTAVNKALQERAVIGEKLNTVRQAERDGIAGATEAEATLYEQLGQVHTESERRAHESVMADLQAQLILAKDNADQRVAIERQIQTEVASYSGGTSNAARQASDAVVSAEQQAADKRLQIEMSVLAGKEAAARFDIGAQIAIENQKLALLDAAGKAGTVEYQNELNRRSDLVRKQGDDAFNISVEKLRQQQATLQDDYTAQLKIEDQILEMYRKHYGDQTTQFQEEVLKRQELLNKDADFQASIAKKIAETNASIASKDGASGAKGAKGGGKGSFSLLSLFGGDDSASSSADAQIAEQKAALDKQMQELQGAYTQAVPGGDFGGALQARNSFNTNGGDVNGLLSQVTGGQGGNASAVIDLLDKAAQAQSAYADKVKGIQEQAAQATKQAWDTVFDGMENKLNSSLIGMLNGTTSWQQGLLRAATSVESTFLNLALKIPEDWAKGQLESLLITDKTQAQQTAATATGTAQRKALGATEDSDLLTQAADAVAHWLGMETAKTGATVAGNATRTASNVTSDAVSAVSTADTASSGIMDHAASAAAAVYDDVSQIPLVGWILAPVAAGAAFTAVAAYSSIASAAGGWDKVPYDGAMTELHKDEMVLPAHLANPIRQAAANMNSPAATAAGNVTPMVRAPSYGQSAGGDGSGGGAGGGDIHLHAHFDGPVNGADPAALQQVVLSTLDSAARNGVPTKYTHLKRAMTR